ncbi:transposase [Dethiosulfatarculus sandiegensis]|uniref:Transposase n=1 Tax=Dethiosulfatarculus sandiegensis TaxID=1429043 RepID=A0A0D2J955_9BACT|nr:transposase [Dethiosulfatarculus sandiegensis]
MGLWNKARDIPKLKSELRRANAILRQVSAFFAQAELDRLRK